MELAIAVRPNQDCAALPSCHTELLLEEVSSLDTVAVDGWVDLRFVGLPSLLQILVGLTVFSASAECW